MTLPRVAQKWRRYKENAYVLYGEPVAISQLSSNATQEKGVAIDSQACRRQNEASAANPLDISQLDDSPIILDDSPIISCGVGKTEVKKSFYTTTRSMTVAEFQ
jgi:hypothetical protein